MKKERFEERRFNRKLMVMISVVIFLLVFSLAVVHFNLSIRDSRRMARNYLGAITTGVKETVDAWLQEKFNTVRLMATSPTLRHFLTHNPAEASYRLRQIFKAGPGYEAVFLADAEGVIRADSHPGDQKVLVDLKTRPYWDRFAAGNYELLLSSQIERSPITGHLVVVIIQGIRNQENRLLGFLGTSIDWERFTEKFLVPVTFGKTGYVAVTDQKGRNIGHPDKSLQLQDLSGETFMQRLIHEKNGFQRYRFRGDMKVMAFRQSAVSGWILNASVNESELIQGAVYTRNLVLVLGAILLVLLLLVVGYLDVFRLTRARDELHRSQQRFQLIFHRGNDGIFVHGMDRQGTPGVFSQANRNFLTLMQMNRRQMIGASAGRVIGDRIGEDYSALLRDVLLQKYRLVETTIQLPGGNCSHVEFRLFLVESRRELAVMGFVRDISLRIRSRQELHRSRDELDRKVRERTLELQSAHSRLQKQFAAMQKMAQALRDSEAKYRSLVERASDGILLVEDGRIVFANERIGEMLKTPPVDLVGRELADIVSRDELDVVMGHYKRRLQGLQTKSIYETRLRANSQEDLAVELNAGLIEYDGKPVDFIFVRDITQRKQTEALERRHHEQLIQADKLAALGTLVSGVAHEINNPNNAILLNLPVLAEAWRDAQPIFEAYRERFGEFQIAGMPYTRLRDFLGTILDDMADGARRIKAIVEDLKDFARPDGGVFRDELDVNGVVRSAVKLVSNQIMKATDQFEIHYAEDLPAIRGNFRRLEQVVVNLLQNACHALKDRKRGIRVYTRNHLPSGMVVIEVADEGVGIPEENMNQIMNPFFTTKRDRGGTGLGLSVSLSLVKEHGGDLRFESEPGMGTRAMILIPAPRATKGDAP
ncbi:MAG: PAS domain S-box protein [Candidatus Aminicenantes bacterium]|nr:PAS domain S-box protein [Candidatus Aminicenantes bacterium]